MSGSTVPIIDKGREAILNDKYRLEEVIGSGGMGIVYRAVHRELNSKVAIKMLRSTFPENRQVISRLYREARAAASIGHDNICEVYDVGTADDDTPFLVMPLLEGTSLSALLKSGKLPLNRLIDIATQTLAALEAAHKSHIVHRDLKPGNIFITRIGDREDFVKLLDFGISKMLDQNASGDDTNSALVLGTPHYMAPEQARGHKQIDHRVDVYAMGVILYRALTGRMPFSGRSNNDILFNIVTNPFPTLRSLDPTIPEAMEKVILKAMARDPLQRFDSAEHMRREFLDATKAMCRSRNNDTGSIGLLTMSATPAHPETTQMESVVIDSKAIVRPSFFIFVAASVLAGGLILLLLTWHTSRQKQRQGLLEHTKSSAIEESNSAEGFAVHQDFSVHAEELPMPSISMVLNPMKQIIASSRDKSEDNSPKLKKSKIERKKKNPPKSPVQRQSNFDGAALLVPPPSKKKASSSHYPDDRAPGGKEKSTVPSGTEKADTVKGLDQTIIYTTYE